METITITLDGREVSGHSGMSVLELARESGVDIPTLCHDPRLMPFGSCRICLVEDKRSGALVASCVTPISPEMVIDTTSPRVIERRKVIVKLMLASHPDSCMVCDKGNHCQLRKIASDLGIGLVDFQRIPQPATIEEVNPFIERDLSKCILCAKCIRADHELVVQGAIDYINRGFSAKPATFRDLPLENSECTFCGTCVSICPTGALMEQNRSYGTTATTVSTVCAFCGCGCSICVEAKGNHIVRVRPGNENAVNHGVLCVRGSYGYDLVHSSERLTSPLVRVNGGFKEIPWEQALELVASEFKRIKKAHGPDSLAVLGSSKCTNEENYLLQRLARGAIGTNNIDNSSRLYSSASQVGLRWTLGSHGTTNSIDYLEQSEVILVIGANPTSSAPIVGYAIKRAVRYKGAKLILVDPRQTGLSSFAHLWLRPKIGTDIALINGLMSVIVAEGLLSEGCRQIDNFEALINCLERYNPDYVENITGVPSQEIRRAARLFAGSNRASIVYGNGITQQVSGTDAVMALANLALLTGKTGLGGGIYALQRDNNGQGACDMGALPDYLPGYQSVEDAQARKKFSDRWGIELPTDAGLTALEMIEHIKEGKIKGMYIVGENPALSFPHLTLVREALASLDFLVVQDMFLSETAKLAKVVLPAASPMEKEGTFTNLEGRVQQLHKVIKSPGDSLPDWEIILQLAKNMGCPMAYNSLREIIDEIKELVPLYQDTGAIQPSSKNEGFYRFSTAQYVPQANVSEDSYPFTLLVGSVLYQFGTGSRSLRSARLKKFQPEAFVEISETDAKHLRISQGEVVKVVSPVGEVTVKVKITDTAPEKILFIPVSFAECPVNTLFNIALDPRSKTPSLKTCAVRLERIEPHG